MALKDLFNQLNELSPLMKEREKLSTEDLVNETLHLQQIDVVQNTQGKYTILIFQEYPENFVFGGSVVTDKLLRVCDALGGMEEMNDALQDEPLALKLVTKRSRNKGSDGMRHYYTDLEVL